ncbi:MAG: hypothetical protein WCW33_01545 [Candidatus Babeliales bacterium]|jgi:hypothetical protein
MKKLFIPALCVGFVTTVSMLDAGISAAQQPQPANVVKNDVVKCACEKTHVAPVSKPEPVVAPAVAAPAPAQPVAEKKAEVPATNVEQEKGNQPAGEEFSDEEFRKQLAELEKLFAEEMKNSEAEDKKDTKASEPKKAAEVK